jgi:cation:H+ antiporter
MLDVLLSLLLVLAGLTILVKSSDYLIDGAADLARWFKISPIVVGLTVVAFGTSLPELMVSLFSVFSNKSSIAIGAIIGSNIANIGLAIGIAAIFAPLIIRSKTLLYEFPFMLAGTTLLLLLANDHYLFHKSTFSLGRIDALIFLGIFALFLFYIFKTIKSERKSIQMDYSKQFEKKEPIWKNSIFIGGGIIGLFLGGKMFISGASKLAVQAGISELFIGLTLAALGTSLPEILVSVRSALKQQTDIGVGNIVGSCIFNIFFVLGLTTLLKPIPIDGAVLALDGMFLLLITGAFLMFATTSKKVTRWNGISLTSLYILYFAFVVIRL